MSSQHKIDATRSGEFNGMDYDEDYVITFSYVRGAPATGPTYSSGGQPAEPAEIEFVSVTPDAGDHGAFTDLAQSGLEQWAQFWLDEHYDECIELAEQDMQPDPDAERDRRIDDQLTGEDR